MNIVSRIQFPQTTETAGLYMKCHEGTSLNVCAEQAASFNKNGVLSLNTYFNSFYENFYAKYTELSTLYYLLRLEGNFQVSCYRESHDQDGRQLIYTESFENCQPSQPVKISLPDSRHEDAGRVYLEINCLSDRGSFTGGFIATDQPKIREVSLGIITCTFKKEVYVKNTLSAILKDDLLQDKKFKVFVVDNGRTLKQDEIDDPRVQLIPNRNVGGSGGFTRGLIQALQEDVHTHFLFMDDDIELDTETIYRLFSLYEYAKQDFAVAGSMLDLYKKHTLFEAGASYGKTKDRKGNLVNCRFKIVGFQHQMDLQNTSSLNQLLIGDNIDYGGFWFFSFSKAVVARVGLPLPFFIKIDDMEFGLRIKEHLNTTIVAFPSIAVWHEPFYAKKPVWDMYYTYRNHLITDSIHSSLGYLDAVKTLTRYLIISLLVFDYNSAKMIIKSFDHYMQGPAFLRNNEPETLHSSICEESKSSKSQTIVANCVSNGNSQLITKVGFLQKLVSLLTLNGHLFPSFLIRDESVNFKIGIGYSESLSKPLAKRRVVLLMEKNPNSYQNELDHLTGIKLLITWLKSVIGSSWRWSAVSAEWKKAAKDLTSIQFWQDYLEPNN